jgi:hypothetical protein
LFLAVLVFSGRVSPRAGFSGKEDTARGMGSRTSVVEKQTKKSLGEGALETSGVCPLFRGVGVGQDSLEKSNPAHFEPSYDRREPSERDMD